MKKLTILSAGQLSSDVAITVIGKEQLKTLLGGLQEGSGTCFELGKACTDDVQCCSNFCGQQCICETRP